MTFQEMLNEEREEGRFEERKEVIFELLQEKSIIDKRVKEKLDGIKNMEQLKQLTKSALSAEDADDFLVAIEALQI